MIIPSMVIGHQSYLPHPLAVGFHITSQQPLVIVIHSCWALVNVDGDRQWAADDRRMGWCGGMGVPNLNQKMFLIRYLNRFFR